MVGSFGIGTVGAPDVEIVADHIYGIAFLDLQTGSAIFIHMDIKVFAAGLPVKVGFAHITAIGKLNADKGISGTGLFFGTAGKAEQGENQEEKENAFHNRPPFRGGYSVMLAILASQEFLVLRMNSNLYKMIYRYAI